MEEIQYVVLFETFHCSFPNIVDHFNNINLVHMLNTYSIIWYGENCAVACIRIGLAASTYKSFSALSHNSMAQLKVMHISVEVFSVAWWLPHKRNETLSSNFLIQFHQSTCKCRCPIYRSRNSVQWVKCVYWTVQNCWTAKWTISKNKTKTSMIKTV